MERSLRIRVSEDLGPNVRRIEVLAPDGTVLGDLAKSVAGVTWKMGVRDGLGIVSIDVACERARIESIEIQGSNIARKRSPSSAGDMPASKRLT